MSTRKDGLPLSVVHSTVSYILQTCGVGICGGNLRVLELCRFRFNGDPDIAGAVDGHGITLERKLATHGFSLHQRGGPTVVDLLECDESATPESRDEIIEQLAGAAGRAALAEGRAALAEGGGFADFNRAYETESRWCEYQTYTALLARIRATSDVCPPAGWEDRAVARAVEHGVI